MKMNWIMMGFLLFTGMAMATTNTPPTPVIVLCAMREGTTLMDITYRVNDPDDAVVSAWPLAFVDGTRSFAKVIRPTTFVEGTENNFGTNVLANTTYQLVWNVGADWDIDLGQLKFEIICKDSRGLLPFDWVSIPATATTEAMTISKNLIGYPSTNTLPLLNALFYQYAGRDEGLSLSNGVLYGAANSGIFSGIELAIAATNRSYAAPYIMRKMNLQPAFQSDVNFAIAARSGVTNAAISWYALSQPYRGMSNILFGVGQNNYGQCNIPVGLANVTALSAGNNHSLAMKSDGSVVAWGFGYGVSVPSGLSTVTAIDAGREHGLALKSDGAVVAWGLNNYSLTNVPLGVTDVIAIAAGRDHNLVLKNNGTVLAWGNNGMGATNVPSGLMDVTAIAAGGGFSLALKSNGTVVEWGSSSVPGGLSNVTAIAAGGSHWLALKSNGTVVASGNNNFGQCSVPVGLSNVLAVAAGENHSVALKNDGTVVAWGQNNFGQCNIPLGLNYVIAIGAGDFHTLMIVQEP